uniref:Uncharacterized protein n=1 Tax=Panagrolaimus superbus TaxID=310955 RepID=A0A914XZU2_9BILA
MISSDHHTSPPPLLPILFDDNKRFLSAIEEEEAEGLEADRQAFSEPAPTDSIRRVHHEADEPFVIELRPSESVEKLIVNQIHTNNLTSLFSFMRQKKNKPIYVAGENVIQTMEKKFNENMNSGIIRSLASEFPTKSCCCRAELPGYCSFCQKHLAISHM